MKDKIIEILNRNIKNRFEKHLSFWPKIEIENLIECSAEEIVNILSGNTVKLVKVCVAKRKHCKSVPVPNPKDCVGCPYWEQTE